MASYKINTNIKTCVFRFYISVEVLVALFGANEKRDLLPREYAKSTTKAFVTLCKMILYGYFKSLYPPTHTRHTLERDTE